MCVVPNELFDSMMKKAKITDDPLITAQVQLEQKKAQILENMGDADADLNEYVNVVHTGGILEEQRKKHAVAVLPPLPLPPPPSSAVRIVTKRPKIVRKVHRKRRVPRIIAEVDEGDAEIFVDALEPAPMKAVGARVPVHRGASSLAHRFYDYDPEELERVVKQKRKSRKSYLRELDIEEPVGPITPKLTRQGTVH